MCTDENGLDLRKLQQLDPVEFEKMYRMLAPQLRAFLTQLCGDPETGFDLTQETFVKVYKALPRIEPDSFRFRPWVYKIATNTTYSYMRQKQFKQILSFNNASKNSQEENEIGQNYLAGARTGSFEKRLEEAEIVYHSLKAIKPEYRAVLLLRWQEGFELDEICLILNLSKDNLKKRLYRAKQAFIEAYRQEYSLSDIGGTQ